MRRCGLLALVCVLVGLIPSTASASVPTQGFGCPVPPSATFSPAGPVAIPASSVAESTVAVSGLSGGIVDIDVTTKIVHPTTGDLTIELVSPGGARSVFLAQNLGGANANVFNGTLWDDGADAGASLSTGVNELLAADHTYADGVAVPKLVPQDALAAFIGDQPNGNWTLRVTETGGVAAGSIDTWSLRVTSATTSNLLSSSGAFTASGGAGTLADGTSLTSTATYAGPLTDRPLRSVQVDLDGFTYEGFGDLTLQLQAPSGEVVTLTRRFAITDPTLPGTLSWRVGAEPATRRTTYSNIMGAEESLGALYGLNPTGTWRLVATDGGVLSGGGSFTRWTLRVVTLPICTGEVDVTLSGPPANSLVGTDVTYIATAKATGPGVLSDLSLEVVTMPALLANTVEPSAGGVCQRSASIRRNVTCTWAGRTLPGETRTMTIRGFQSIAGVAANSIQIVPRARFLPETSTTRQATYGPFPVRTNPKYRAANGARCTVVGTQGNDDFSTPLTKGVICGRGGDDQIAGFSSSDVLDGGTGNDVIFGKSGSDLIFGGKGNDTIIAGNGNDTIDGGAGKDRIDAGAGNDRIIGGLGKDVINGNAGKDAAKRDAPDVFKRVEVFFTR